MRLFAVLSRGWSLPLHDRALTKLRNARRATASAVGRTRERSTGHRLVTSAVVALAVATTAVPFAHATTSGNGSKLQYPQLFAHENDIDDGYKSGYPQLHAIHTYKASTSPATSSDDGHTSGFPQLHAIDTLRANARPIRTADRTFHWSDAAVGAGTAALAILLAAAGALVLSRRHDRIAV